ncbi:hypothetical protein V8F06_014768, partial [Rhypophila decipiens]
QDISDVYTLEVALGYSIFEPAAAVSQTEAFRTQPICPTYFCNAIGSDSQVGNHRIAQASRNLAEHSFVNETHMLLQRPRTPSSEDSITRPSTRTSLINPRCAGAAPFADNEFVFRLNRNNVRGFFSELHSPSPPQALLVSENLLYNIKVYFENSCRNMNFDNYGNLLTPNGAKLDNTLCNDFDSYCFTATLFIEKGLHVEFRRALSKASALVEKILQAEHPRTLACFLEVFIHLIQTGLCEVTSFLRGYIGRMAAQVTKKGHPWRQICRLLSELDSESLHQAMAQIWKCTTDIFDRELGAFSRLAVSVRLDYIKRMVADHGEEERLLRHLLARFEGIATLSTPRVMLNLAHNLNRQGHYGKAEEMALEARRLLQGHAMYACRIAERIESLKIVSHSQFHQGKALEAEKSIREAIQMIVHQWGIQHSWVPEFMSVLEGWLRVWGREEDADTLRRQMEELIGGDEIDE